MSRPVLVINPRGDRSFVRLAEQLAAGGIESPEDLQQGLATTYPEVVVHRRELSGEPTEIWYVYRDGHWVPNGRH